MKRGKLIAIVGTDGSGKETQKNMLVQRLKNEGYGVQGMSFPRYDTPTGKVIGEYYLGKDLGLGTGAVFGEADKVDAKLASILYAQDRYCAKPEMEKILESGKHLILDRYYQDNMAHQGGKIESFEEREKMFNWLENLELGLYGIPKEDATIFLHMPRNVAIELRNRRGEKTGEKADGHESNPEHLIRAENTFLHLTDKYNWKRINCTKDGTIDTLKNPNQIHDEVWDYVSKILSE